MSQISASVYVEQDTTPYFTPLLVTDVDISQHVAGIPLDRDLQGNVYQRALILIRFKGEPLGYLELPVGSSGLSANTIVQEAWRLYGTAIVARLEADQEDTQRQSEDEALLPFVSVVVATHNRPAQVASCISTLLLMDYPSFELVIVDNAPRNDETARMIASTFCHTGKVHYCRETRAGLSRARNCGIRAARGDYIAFTDDDVIADRRWLRSLIETLIAHPQAMCVTGMIIPLELETLPQLWLEQFGGFNKGFHRAIYTCTSHTDNPLYPYTAGAFGSGANMCFRRLFLESIGGFDTALGTGTSTMGGEDLAVFFEVIIRGATLIYEPSAIIRHPHHREYHKLRRQIYGYGAGLSAFLTACVVRHPSHLIRMSSRLVAGITYLFNQRSPKNRHKGSLYPAELTRLELFGILSGPFRYLHSALYQRVAYRTQTPL